MDNISERPWKVGHRDKIEDADGFYISWPISSSINAKHIVKCVNEHDNLVSEVERLKSEKEFLKLEMIKFIEEQIRPEFYHNWLEERNLEELINSQEIFEFAKNKDNDES